MWDPVESKTRLKLSGDPISLCAVGACSGDILTHSIDNSLSQEAKDSLNKREFEPYAVTYHPGGRVDFHVNHDFHGSAQLEEDIFLSQHKSTACLVFWAALENSDYTVKVLAAAAAAQPLL